MRMHILSGGRLCYRRSIYYPSASRDETIELPVTCVLVKHKQGLVLFDTGCHPTVSTNAEARWSGLARLMPPIMAAGDAVIAQLPKAGVTAEDVDVAACSHLHPDHCGCNAFFPRAAILAQAAEIAAAYAENAAGQGYLSLEFDATPLTPVDGERDLFGDGRLTLLPLSGHTPGSMGMHVVLNRDGAFLLASDAVAVRAHLDQRYAPKNTWNVDAALASIGRVAGFQRDGATVLFGHDDEQWRTLRTGEAFYA